MIRVRVRIRIRVGVSLGVSVWVMVRGTRSRRVGVRARVWFSIQVGARSRVGVTKL